MPVCLQNATRGVGLWWGCARQAARPAPQLGGGAESGLVGAREPASWRLVQPDHVAQSDGTHLVAPTGEQSHLGGADRGYGCHAGAPVRLGPISLMIVVHRIRPRPFGGWRAGAIVIGRGVAGRASSVPSGACEL